jgi:hypothetical protein
MRDQSPFEAVTSWLKREFNIEPNNIQLMMLLDEVRRALPPKGDNTIAALRAILRSLEPHNGLDAWCHRMSREIVDGLAKIPEVKQIARIADNEGFWCQIEGTLSGMLKRVTRGQDLEGPEAGPLPRSQGHVLAITVQELWWLRRKVDEDQDPARGYSLERGDHYINAVSLLLDKIGDYAAEGLRMRKEIEEAKKTAFKAWLASDERCIGPAQNNLEIEFKRASFEKWWENRDKVLVHADGGACHGAAVVHGRCSKCGIAPDMQSTEFWPPDQVK